MISGKLRFQRIFSRLLYKVKKTLVHHQKDSQLSAAPQHMKKKFPVCKDSRGIIGIAEKNHVQISVKPVNKIFLHTKAVFLSEKHMLHLTSYTCKSLFVFSKCGHRNQGLFGAYSLTE